MDTFVRRTLRWTTPILMVVLMTACASGDARVENLTVGIPKDSAVTLMGGQVHQLDPYLVEGRYIEALLFASANTKPEDAASVQPRDFTPLIVVDGQLAGWGWDFWDSVATKHRIQIPPKT